MDNKPFIHLFKTYGNFYIYDVNKNSIIKVEKDTWKYLNNDTDLICNNLNAIEKIQHLKEKGFLSSNRVQEILHPADEILEDYISNRVLMVCLQVTQQCNLRCEYCAYSGGYDNRQHTNKRMTLELAKKGIDFLITRSSDLKKVAVGFYGGEPLLEFELIQDIVEYVNRNAVGKEVIFTITTNATLITKEIIEYFNQNNIHMVISLDGPKEIHDKNRKFVFNKCGTFDKVVENIQLIKKEYPEYMKNVTFNAVLDPQNDLKCVHEFFDDFDTIKESAVMYSQISNYYSKTQIGYDEAYYIEMNYELFKLFLSKLDKLDEKYISKLVNSRIGQLQDIYDHFCKSEKLPEKMHHGGPCIPGTQRLFLNAFGEFYPCEKVSETSSITRIGNIEDGLDLNRVRQILNVGKLTEGKCKNCWAIRFCNQCIASADSGKGMEKDIKAERCYGSVKRAEDNLKDICTLIEFGYKFTS